MRMTRRQMRKMILKEMDMMGMGADPSLIEHAKNVLEIGMGMGLTLAPLILILLTIPLSPGLLFQMLESYHRDLLTEAEFKEMHRIYNEEKNPERARAYFDSVVRAKGYDNDRMGPRHMASGRRDATYAQDYSAEHGDILPPTSFEFDDGEEL